MKGSTPEKEILYKAQNVNPISFENEERALKRLKVLCSDALKDYSTTCEEDEKLLKAGGLNFNTKNCLIYRHSEKKVKALDLPS